jgi:hypothetical protein
MFGEGWKDSQQLSDAPRCSSLYGGAMVILPFLGNDDVQWGDHLSSLSPRISDN